MGNMETETTKKAFVNIPEIRKIVSEKHKEFIKKAGSLTEKVEADKHLLIGKVQAHIGYILQTFAEEGIIDSVTDKSEGKSVYLVVISKSRHDNSLHIASDGENIFLWEHNLMSNIYITEQFLKTFRDIHLEDFDWTKFAIDLLDAIHIHVYGRKRIMENMLSQVFSKLEDVDEHPPKGKIKIRLRKPTDGSPTKTIRV